MPSPVDAQTLLGEGTWTFADVRKKRLEICKACPKLQMSVCLLCGCYVSSRTAGENSYCPLGKW